MKIEYHLHKITEEQLKEIEEIDTLLGLLTKIKTPIEGKTIFPVHQRMLNRMIHFILTENSWKPNPFIDTRSKNERFGESKGDFCNVESNKPRILVEVEFGNVASSYRDLIKFCFAHTLKSYDIGILILPMANLGKKIAITQSYEKIKNLIELGKDFINLPLIIIGIDSDSDPDSDIDFKSLDKGNILVKINKKTMDIFIKEYKTELFN